MSASVNKFIGIGNITKEPETRFTKGGDAITNITIACNESFKDKQGNKQERAEFIRVTFFGKLAEIAGEYLVKGAPVYIEGRLKTDKYTDKEGIERYQTGIIANEMRMLGSKPSGETRDKSEPVRQQQSKQSGGGFEDFESDIPF